MRQKSNLKILKFTLTISTRLKDTYETEEHRAKLQVPSRILPGVFNHEKTVVGTKCLVLSTCTSKHHFIHFCCGERAEYNNIFRSKQHG